MRFVAPNILLLLSLWPGSLQAQPASAPSWASLPQAWEAAQAAERPLLLYIHAAWCGPCLQMERDVFPEAAPLLRRFALAKLDFDDHETPLLFEGRTQSPFAWARHFGASAPPAFVLLDADGILLTRTTGALDARSFTLLLAYVATGAHRHTPFEAYIRQTTQGH